MTLLSKLSFVFSACTAMAILFAAAPAYAMLTAPMLSSPANGAKDQDLTVKLSWYDVSGATRYRVFVADSQSTLTSLSATTTSCYKCAVNTTTSSEYYYIPSGKLDGNTTYYWMVRAETSSEEGPYSQIRSFTTEWEKLSTPSLSSPSSGATNQPLNVKLAWYSVSYAKTYRVFIATSSSTLSFLSDTATECNNCTLTAVATTYNYTVPLGKLTGNTKYYWMVRAESPTAMSQNSSSRYFTTTFGELPAPSLSSPSNGAVDQPLTVKLSWWSVSGAKKYRVFVASSESTLKALTATAETCSSCAVCTTTTSTSHSIPSGKLKEGTKYFWTIRAENDTAKSPNSQLRYFTTKKSVQPCPGIAGPMLSFPKNGQSGLPVTPTLEWGDVLEASEYWVFIALSQSSLTGLDQTTTSCPGCVINERSFPSSYTVPYGYLPEGYQVFWMVRALSQCGASANSAIWEFRTAGGQAGQDVVSGQDCTGGSCWPQPDTIPGVDTWNPGGYDTLPGQDTPHGPGFDSANPGADLLAGKDTGGAWQEDDSGGSPFSLPNQKKSGGSGCTLASSSHPASAAGLAVVAFLLLGLRGRCLRRFV